jgi:hypothetical protein
VKFVVYEGAICSWGNLCRIAGKASKLVLKDMSKAPSKVCWHIMFVSEVGGDLRAFHRECIVTRVVPNLMLMPTLILVPARILLLAMTLMVPYQLVRAHNLALACMLAPASTFPSACMLAPACILPPAYMLALPHELVQLMGSHELICSSQSLGRLVNYPSHWLDCHDVERVAIRRNGFVVGGRNSRNPSSLIDAMTIIATALSIREN